MYLIIYKKLNIDKKDKINVQLEMYFYEIVKIEFFKNKKSWKRKLIIRLKEKLIINFVLIF